MSIIGRKPFVETIIGSCNSTQAKSVSTLLNNLGSFITVSLFNTSDTLGANYEISSSLKTEVKHVHFMLDKNKIIDGILVYLSDSKCALFGFNDDTGIVTEFDINPVAKTYNQINEHCTAEELRQVVGDKLIEVGDGDFVSEEELETAVSDRAKVWEVGWDNENQAPDLSSIFPALGDIIKDVDGSSYLVTYYDSIEIHLTRVEDGWKYMYDIEDDHLVYASQQEPEDLKGTNLYQHRIIISKSGGSPYQFIFITNSRNPMSMNDTHIGQYINGWLISQGEVSVKRSTIPIKPFPSAEFMTFSCQETQTVGDVSNVVVILSVNVTPTNITDTVTEL